MKTHAFAAVLAAALLASVAHGDDGDTRRLAEELLDAMKVGRNLETVQEQAKNAIARQVEAMKVPDTMKDRSAKFQKDMIDVVFSELSYANMKAAYVDIYVSTFTPEELSGLVAFYKSATGRAFVDKFPAVTSKMIDLSQSRMKALEPRRAKLSEDFEADLRKAGASK